MGVSEFQHTVESLEHRQLGPATDLENEKVDQEQYDESKNKGQRKAAGEEWRSKDRSVRQQ